MRCCCWEGAGLRTPGREQLLFKPRAVAASTCPAARAQPLASSSSHPSPTTPTCSATPRLDTDVALGRAGGLLTVLPMTGVTTEAKLAAAAPGELPHYVVPNLAALAGLEF